MTEPSLVDQEAAELNVSISPLRSVDQGLSHRQPPTAAIPDRRKIPDSGAFAVSVDPRFEPAAYALRLLPELETELGRRLVPLAEPAKDAGCRLRLGSSERLGSSGGKQVLQLPT